MSKEINNNEYRRLPSVDELLRNEFIAALLSVYPRELVLEAVRDALGHAREKIAAGEFAPETSDLVRLADSFLRRSQLRSLRRAINATGVIVHTGLGRSVLPQSAVDAVAEVACSHSLLEIDPTTGKRGSRQVHAESLLSELTHAEAGMVVNNNAAAVMLCINTLANGREVIISRGQLVEIGGSFRLPDIIERAGGQLVEAGTTNRTRIADYANAITDNTGIILRCHPSNFKISGFFEETPLSELVELGRKAGVPVVDDLGSGALIDVSRFGLEYEPTVQESVDAGASLVTFSGDKLLGASQAGIIVGNDECVSLCRSNPLARAIRVDKLTLAGLEATLRIYRYGDPVSEIPTLSAVSKPIYNIENQAKSLARRINALKLKNVRATVERTESETGGGSLPGQSLESRAVALRSAELSAEDFSERFRGNNPPIFGRIVRDVYFLDMRTVTPGECKEILECVRKLGSHTE